MKLAIEHLQQSIAATERALTESKSALHASQRQCDDHAAAVSLAERKLADYTAALAALRGSTASAVATVVNQIQKTQFTAPAPRPTLSRKSN
jgi:hypothetical protein